MLTFISSNVQKHAEVERILGRSLARKALSLEEIQAIALEPVVRHKARRAFAALGAPVLVEDTGLSFTAWNGLPGALIKWFLMSLGPAGLCRLLRQEMNRQATATTMFAYCDGADVRVFPGVVHGLTPEAPRGSAGFGWDGIFQPVGSLLTFAEMTPEEKDRFSMRRTALERVRDSGLFF